MVFFPNLPFVQCHIKSSIERYADDGLVSLLMIIEGITCLQILVAVTSVLRGVWFEDVYCKGVICGPCDGSRVMVLMVGAGVSVSC
jgi:hypothetical protein